MTTTTDPSTTPITTPTATTTSPPAGCTTAVPGRHGYVPQDACNANYNYDPQFAPAVAVAVLFGLLTAAHVVEAVLFRKRYAWVLLMGATWETVAFVLLALGSRDQQQQAYAMAHQILFLLAPLWVNAFSYMTLARTAHFFLPHRAARPRDDAHPGDGRARLDASPSDRPPTVLAVRSTAISKLFVWADVVTFLVQATGGVMINPDPSQAKTSAIGLKVYMVGVGIQQGCILCFTAMVARFEWKMRRLEGCVADARRRRGDSLEAGRSSLEEYGGAKKGWRPVTYAQYAVLVAISVRIIFRIAEFAGGIDPQTNPLPFHEVYSYALDAFPMMVAFLVLAVWHPGRWLQGPHSDFRLVRAARKAAKQARKAAKKADKATRKEQKQMERRDKKQREDARKQARQQEKA